MIVAWVVAAFFTWHLVQNSLVATGNDDYCRKAFEIDMAQPDRGPFYWVCIPSAYAIIETLFYFTMLSAPVLLIGAVGRFIFIGTRALYRRFGPKPSPFQSSIADPHLPY